MLVLQSSPSTVARVAGDFLLVFPSGVAAESFVTFHCGQTIILGVGPSQTHTLLLLTASLAVLLPLQLQGKGAVLGPPLPSRLGTVLETGTARSAELG